MESAGISPARTRRPPLLPSVMEFLELHWTGGVTLALGWLPWLPTLEESTDISMPCDVSLWMENQTIKRWNIQVIFGSAQLRSTYENQGRGWGNAGIMVWYITVESLNVPQTQFHMLNKNNRHWTCHFKRFNNYEEMSKFQLLQVQQQANTRLQDVHSWLLINY